MKQRKCIWVATLGLASVLTGCSGSEPRDKNHVRIATGGTGAVQSLALFVAEGLDFFSAEGIDVDVESLNGDSRSLQAFVGGSADLFCGSFDAALQMAARGHLIRAFTVIALFPGYSVVASPGSDIASVAELKGRPVGVSGHGAGSHLFLNRVLQQAQVPRESVTVIAVGSGRPGIAAVQARQVDAVSAGVLTTVRILAESPQSKVLVAGFDSQTLRHIYAGKPYPGGVIVATYRWLREHPDKARKVSKALQRALRWIHEHSPEQIVEAVPASRTGADKQVYKRAVELVIPLLSRDGNMPHDAAPNVLQILAAVDDQVRTSKIDPASTYTNEYLDAALLQAK
jgi:NitT/TauT family transport system substrate-binding protein